jgi:uncharacterized DUF497 family protein
MLVASGEIEMMVRFIVFTPLHDNISVISWRSVLLVEETRENPQPVASH